MTNTYQSPCTTRNLNDWLCTQLIRQDVNSLIALHNIAREHPEYGADPEQGTLTTAQVWDARGKFRRAFVTKAEIDLLTRTDPRRADTAIVLLLQIRAQWKQSEVIAPSARAEGRPFLDHHSRTAFEAAVDLLVKTGCVEKVSSFRRGADGKRYAAQYTLAPVRETIEAPTKATSKPVDAVSRPEPSATKEPELPPVSQSEAETIDTQLAAAAKCSLEAISQVLEPGEDLHEHGP